MEGVLRYKYDCLLVNLYGTYSNSCSVMNMVYTRLRYEIVLLNNQGMERGGRGRTAYIHSLCKGSGRRRDLEGRIWSGVSSLKLWLSSSPV
jgi:hypothetical protein